MDSRVLSYRVVTVPTQIEVLAVLLMLYFCLPLVEAERRVDHRHQRVRRLRRLARHRRRLRRRLLLQVPLLRGEEAEAGDRGCGQRQERGFESRPCQVGKFHCQDDQELQREQC